MNRESAKMYGVDPERVHENWTKLLDVEKDRLDAVVVLTPTPTHAGIVMGCLMRGVPVICEKALAVNSAEARQILEVRNSTNGFLAVTYNYSGYPMVRELRSLIRKGILGRILHFQAEMPQEGFRRLDAHGKKPVPQAWRLTDGSIPTIHLDLAVHLHHLVHYLTGQSPCEVVSDQNSYGWFGVIDNVTCLCRYTKGIQGQFWFSKSALGHRNGLRLRIYGSKAAAEWYQANPEELVLCFLDGRRQILDRAASVHVTSQRRYNRFKAGHPAGFVEAFANLYGDVWDCLRQYKESGKWSSEEVFSVELALEGLAMFDAMQESARVRTWHKVKWRLDRAGIRHGTL
jgi:predicted dehydrogenase